MSRDFSKALENIRKVMRDQDSEFRRETGLGPRKPKPEPQIPSLTPEPQLPHEDSNGKFSADRFLETSIESDSAPAPEIVEVIQQKDSRHSWLYNEVAKAVQNASDGSPNTKVVAVFVPVVQSGHEFEELPVHETVELPPVHESDFNFDDDIDIQDDPIASEHEPAEPEMPSLPDDEPQEPEMPSLPDDEPQEPEMPSIPDDEPQEPEIPSLPDAEPQEPEMPLLPDAEPQEPEIPSLPDDEPQEPEMPSLPDDEPQEPETPDFPEELSSEPEQAQHLDELIPESMEHPDPELAEAFNTMEEKLDALPELELPDELEDDEIIDDIDDAGEDTQTL